jgi:hypothetical protein
MADFDGGSDVGGGRLDRANFSAVVGDFVAASWPGWRLTMRDWEIEPMLARASPRKPMVRMRKRSSSVASLLVA